MKRYFCEYPTSIEENYLSSIEITSFVKMYLKVIIQLVDFLDYDEYHWFKISTIKFLFQEDHWNFKKSIHKHNIEFLELKKSYNTNKLKLEKCNRLDDYQIHIVILEEKKYNLIFQILGNAILIFDKHIELPDWCCKIPFPQPMGELSVKYFSLRNDALFFHHSNLTSNHNVSERNVLIIVRWDGYETMYKAKVATKTLF